MPCEGGANGAKLSHSSAPNNENWLIPAVDRSRLPETAWRHCQILGCHISK